jgi:hypothetical protein
VNSGRIDVIARGVEPQGPLGRVGVHEGDRLRLDIRWNDFRTLAVGEVFGFIRVSPGTPKHFALVVPEYQGHSKNVGNYRFLITLFDLGVGLLLFFRRRGDVGAETLGMAFIAATISSNFSSSPGWSPFPTFIAVDDPTLVAMRAKRGPIYPTDTASALPAALALPMLHRNDLLELVLLAAKPGDDSYRPDEVEDLCNATHQVGNDLHALKIEELERERVKLSLAVQRLENENAVYRQVGEFEGDR